MKQPEAAADFDFYTPNFGLYRKMSGCGLLTSGFEKTGRVAAIREASSIRPGTWEIRKNIATIAG
ncbi:MAG: hypothetical protein LBD24_09480 [Spirochaetaceae bacterium]|jgi:hypothetical protein|nr:hypothetical protein [Spirochaetaceae bacterium]